MRLKGKPIEADKTYKVAGWAPVADHAAQAQPAEAGRHEGQHRLGRQLARLSARQGGGRSVKL
jgi:hypothetical protein